MFTNNSNVPSGKLYLFVWYYCKIKQCRKYVINLIIYYYFITCKTVLNKENMISQTVKIISLFKPLITIFVLCYTHILVFRVPTTHINEKCYIYLYSLFYYILYSSLKYVIPLCLDNIKLISLICIFHVPYK